MGAIHRGRVGQRATLAGVGDKGMIYRNSGRQRHCPVTCFTILFAVNKTGNGSRPCKGDVTDVISIRNEIDALTLSNHIGITFSSEGRHTAYGDIVAISVGACIVISRNGSYTFCTFYNTSIQTVLGRHYITCNAASNTTMLSAWTIDVGRILA